MLKPNGFTAVHLKEELELKLHFPVDLVRYRERMNPLLKKPDLLLDFSSSVENNIVSGSS